MTPDSELDRLIGEMLKPDTIQRGNDGIAVERGTYDPQPTPLPIYPLPEHLPRLAA